MALTMTRNRTQTALTKLVETLANLKGELAFVDAWLAEPGAPAELGARREVLAGQVDALVATLKQFDPGLELGQVAVSDGWLRRFGRKSVSAKTVRRKYLQEAPK